MEGIDVIGHLVSVEQQAAGLLLDAQVEADKRIAQSRILAENDFKSQYEKIVQDNENSCAQQIREITQKHDENFSEFVKKIQSIPKDTERFNSLLDSLLFKQ